MFDDFPTPEGVQLAGCHRLASIQEARAVTAGVGWFRSLLPWNPGVLCWQLTGKRSGQPEPGMRVEVAGVGRRVRVHADTLLRDLTLDAERLHPEALVDDGVVTLLPGEPHTFRIETPVDPDADALSTKPVLRTSGELARAEPGWTPAEIQIAGSA